MAACDNIYGNFSQWFELFKFLCVHKPEYLIHMKFPPPLTDEKIRICYTAEIQEYLKDNFKSEWAQEELVGNFSVQKAIFGQPHHIRDKNEVGNKRYRNKKIKLNPKNPRQISSRQSQLLEKLMGKYGLIDKPIVNLDMTLIGGDQRIRILKKKKFKKVECWVADRQLEKHELDELCIGLNKNQGEFDYDILANYEVVDLINWGFDEKELLDIVWSEDDED